MAVTDELRELRKLRTKKFGKRQNINQGKGEDAQIEEQTESGDLDTVTDLISEGSGGKDAQVNPVDLNQGHDVFLRLNDVLSYSGKKSNGERIKPVLTALDSLTKFEKKPVKATLGSFLKEGNSEEIRSEFDRYYNDFITEADKYMGGRTPWTTKGKIRMGMVRAARNQAQKELNMIQGAAVVGSNLTDTTTFEDVLFGVNEEVAKIRDTNNVVTNSNKENGIQYAYGELTGDLNLDMSVSDNRTESMEKVFREILKYDLKNLNFRQYSDIFTNRGKTVLLMNTLVRAVDQYADEYKTAPDAILEDRDIKIIKAKAATIKQIGNFLEKIVPVAANQKLFGTIKMGFENLMMEKTSVLEQVIQTIKNRADEGEYSLDDDERSQLDTLAGVRAGIDAQKELAKGDSAALLYRSELDDQKGQEDPYFHPDDISGYEDKYIFADAETLFAIMKDREKAGFLSTENDRFNPIYKLDHPELFRKK